MRRRDSNFAAWACLAIAAGSATLLGGAFAFQEWGGLAPCELCVWQRYPHGAVIALGLLGFAISRSRASGLILALAGLVLIGGAGIAAFHVGVEQLWWEGTRACSGVSPAQTVEDVRPRLAGMPVRCTDIAWSFAGISMAGYNGALSLGLAFMALSWARRLARVH